METFVHSVDPTKQGHLLAYLKEHNFEITKPAHAFFAGRKPGLSVTLFESGKCVVQGKNSLEFIEFFLEPEILGTFGKTHKKCLADLTPRIGVDESGKGDFFGPLVIAGVYADGETVHKLIDLGVKDSKTLGDKAIQILAQKIKKVAPHQIVLINPQKYNEIYANFKNLNALLAWGHATVIENLSERSQCLTVIIDQFADEKVVIQALKRKKVTLQLTQRHRGEEDPVVAAASILARDAFVHRLQTLSDEAGLILPKGASAAVVAAGRKIEPQRLSHFAKLHFKTLDKVLERN